MRHGVSPELAADAIEAEVGHVMLAATIEAPTDFDVQTLYRLVHLEAFLGQPGAQFGGQAARRRDAELAGVGPRAGDDVDQCARTGIPQAHRLQRSVDLRQIAFAHPANHKILFDRGADRFLGEAANDIGQRSQLIGRDVAQRKRNRDRPIAGLLLRARVGLQPAFEGFRRPYRNQRYRFAARAQRRFPRCDRISHVFGPARIEGQIPAFFHHQLFEFFNPQILHQELDTSPVSILLLSILGEHPSDRLRQGQ